jgi:hypothetical protein
VTGRQPAAAPATVEVLIARGRVLTGRWCGRCLLPSAALVEMVAITGTGVHPVAAWENCGGCGVTTRWRHAWPR